MCNSAIAIVAFIISFYTDLIFLTDAVWFNYTNAGRWPDKTYLLVHHPDAENQNRFFTCVGWHAEKNFMEAFKADYGERYKAGNKCVKLDIYLTYAPCGVLGMDCARQLKVFAEEYNFELNIKAAWPYYENQTELSLLMTSPICTVEAFKKDDYKNLAGYLGLPIIPQATIDRDQNTEQELKQIQYGEYSCIKYYSILQLIKSLNSNFCTCHNKYYICISLFYISFVNFLAESVLMLYTEEITPPYPRYLFVYNPVDEEQTRLFRSDELHVEQKFMKFYKKANKERYNEDVSLAELDIYLTFAPCGAQELDCARELRKFAEDYKFILDIKAAEPYQENEEDLCYLMTSQYCTVRSFTGDDYRNLAEYLGFKVPKNWVPSPATIKRDEQTRQTFQRIQNNVN